MPSVFPPARAASIGELAVEPGLSAERPREAARCFNAACGGGSAFHPDRLDGVRAADLDPPKSDWALPVAEPLFFGCPLRPGAAFTSLGPKVDGRARCISAAGPMRNLRAVGETMPWSILGQGCMAGFGMALGTAFGRIAGREAASHAG